MDNTPPEAENQDVPTELDPNESKENLRKSYYKKLVPSKNKKKAEGDHTLPIGDIPIKGRVIGTAFVDGKEIYSVDFSSQSAEIEAFRKEYQYQLGVLLDSGIYEDLPLPPDPYSMGIRETNLEELNREQLSAVRDILFGALGVDREDPSFLQRVYKTEAPQGALVPGEISATVFKTNREGLFLQELTYADSQQRWVIGPDVNI